MMYSCIHGEPRAVVCDVSVVTAEEDLPCEYRGGAVAGAINESSISSAAAASWRPALITSRLGSRLIDTHWRHARLAPAGDEAR